MCHLRVVVFHAAVSEWRGRAMKGEVCLVTNREAWSTLPIETPRTILLSYGGIQCTVPRLTHPVS